MVNIKCPNQMIRPDYAAETSNLSMLAVVFGVHVTPTVVNKPADAIILRYRTTWVEDIAALATRWYFILQHFSPLWIVRGLCFCEVFFFPPTTTLRNLDHLHHQSDQLPESVFFPLFKTCKHIHMCTNIHVDFYFPVNGYATQKFVLHYW